MQTTLLQTTEVITAAELLHHWQGHRALTRRVIEAFPEDQFFNYTIGGMRPFSAMVMELLGIAVPALREIVSQQTTALNEQFEHGNQKSNLLQLWDAATEEINTLYHQIPAERFHERINLFGQYENTVWASIFYFIDNEIHHRAQGYVYLRSLGIEPPPFWDRP
jgi:uncharacterized damage-inducible protein DinB